MCRSIGQNVAGVMVDVPSLEGVGDKEIGREVVDDRDEGSESIGKVEEQMLVHKPAVIGFG